MDADETRSEFAKFRFRELCLNAGMSDEEATGTLDMLSNVTGLLALVLSRNASKAPNFLTVALRPEGESEGWELTIRKHDGQTPADKLAALEAERDEALRRLAELEPR